MGAGTTFRTIQELQDSNTRVVVAGLAASDAPLLLQCQQLAEELKQVVRRAVGLHQQVNFLFLFTIMFPW